MATVIDQIIVELNLDPKNFEQATKKQAEAWLKTRQEAEKTHKTVGESVDKLALSFNNLALKVAGFLAAFVGLEKMAKFGADLVQANIGLRNIAQITGISVTTISQWGQAAERAGSSVASMNSAILGMDRAIKEFDSKGGGSELGTLLRNFHDRGIDISRNNPQGGRKTATEMITEIMSAMDKLHYTDQDKNRAMRALGVMDDSVIVVLNKGLDAWKKLLDEQKSIGLVTDENIKSAEALTKAWYAMTQQVEGLGRAILDKLANPLVEVFGAAGNVAQGKVEYPAKGTPNFFDDARSIWGSLKKGAAKATEAGKSPTLNDRFGPFGDSGDIPKKATPNQFSVGAQSISGASQTASALGITPAQYDAFRQGMANIESSGGNYGLMGGAGRKYAGAYQLSREEIDRAAKSFGERSPSQTQFLSDKQMQERYFDAVTRMNHEQLLKNARYAAMSPTDQLKMLGYAHNQGAHGAEKFLATGRTGRDAFGTPGTRYISEIDRQLKDRDDPFERGGTPLPLLSNPRLLRAPRYNMGYGQGGNYSTSETVVHSMIVNGAKQPTDDAYGIAVDANQSLERGRFVQQFTTGPM
jgi:hypothetical protein